MVATPSSPATEQANRLSLAFDIFNTELFNGELSPVMLTVSHKAGSYGYFQPSKWKSSNGQLVDVINLDSKTATDRPLIELLSTLVHEMAHQYVRRVINGGMASGGHGPDWRKIMVRVGLPPVKIGSTWRQATHSIEVGGAFEQAFHKHQSELQTLPWKECIKEINRGNGVDRVKFHCDRCGSNAWARPAALLLCGNCSTTDELVEMVPEFRAEGGGGKGSGKAATAKREHYPEPTCTPGLPVWTDELGREMRTHTGLDHPPTTGGEALTVMVHGLKIDAETMHKARCASDEGNFPERFGEVLKQLYIQRCKVLHPDVDGGSEVAFKSLQVAYRILKSRVVK